MDFKALSSISNAIFSLSEAKCKYNIPTAKIYTMKNLISFNFLLIASFTLILYYFNIFFGTNISVNEVTVYSFQSICIDTYARSK